MVGNGISFTIHPDVSGLSSEISATGEPALSSNSYAWGRPFLQQSRWVFSTFFCTSAFCKAKTHVGAIWALNNDDEGTTLELPSLLLHGQMRWLQPPSRSPCLAISASVSPDNRRT